MRGGAGAISEARRLVRRATGGLPGVGPTAELLVSELVTNAVVHGGGRFSLEVEVRPGGIRIAVADRSPSPPVVRTAASVQEHGRGMAIVAALASAWGTDRRRRGKAVWVELTASPVAAGRPGALT